MKGPTNTELKKLLVELKTKSLENKVPLWKRVASDLERPARIRRKVNLYKINRSTRDGETALVPGKVLSLGNLDKKLTIAAFQFSESALSKIKAVGGSAVTIKQLLDKNPKASKVRIIG